MAIKKKRTRIRARREYGIAHTCDLCEDGRATAMALVEGERLALCNGCKKFGRVLFSLNLDGNSDPKGIQKGSASLGELVDNYGKIIHTQRQQIGLSIDALAQRLRERKSYLQKIESGVLRPSLGLARKLQGALGIKLLEKEES